jgi:hypothetical protein
MIATQVRLFSIKPCGDFSAAFPQWDVLEYEHSFDDGVCTYRGDISSLYARDPLIRYLRQTYPGCTIRVER